MKQHTVHSKSIRFWPLETWHSDRIDVPSHAVMLRTEGNGMSTQMLPATGCAVQTGPACRTNPALVLVPWVTYATHAKNTTVARTLCYILCHDK